MGGRGGDSPYLRMQDSSPYLRAQEAKYGHASGFSLGPGMHEAGAMEGGGAGGGAADTPQSTADLTAFWQLLDKSLLDEMASRIEELERAVDEVLKEITTDEDGSLPSPKSSPMRKALAGPVSPDVRKLTSGSASFSGVSVKDAVAKFTTTGAPVQEIRRQLSAAPALGIPGPPKSPDLRRHSSQNMYVPTSPDPRRHSSQEIFGSQAAANNPDIRRQSLSGSLIPRSPDVRKSTGVPLTNVPSSPDPRRRTDSFASGMR
ncbi:hypothetical protein R1sor_008776 [Riccia sorocarpa]|uniref:Uncharacterized protein n=1 Tax=Riccia sorocarpa TaxID=122646 RepID=A0ABD3HXZ3_9MARC